MKLYNVCLILLNLYLLFRLVIVVIVLFKCVRIYLFVNDKLLFKLIFLILKFLLIFIKLKCVLF